MTHPAAESVLIWFEGDKEGDAVIWRRSATSPGEKIAALLIRWRTTNDGVMNAAFVPAFMSLLYSSQGGLPAEDTELEVFPA
jgi:hypothetical protein